MENSKQWRDEKAKELKAIPDHEDRRQQLEKIKASPEYDLAKEKKKSAAKFINVAKQCLESYRTWRNSPIDRDRSIRTGGPHAVFFGFNTFGKYFPFLEWATDVKGYWYGTAAMAYLEKLFDLEDDYQEFIETGESKFNPDGYKEGPYSVEDMSDELGNLMEYEVDPIHGPLSSFRKKVCEILGFVYEKHRPGMAARYFELADKEQYKDLIPQLRQEGWGRPPKVGSEEETQHRERVFRAVRELREAGKTDPALKVDFEGNLVKLIAMVEEAYK
jgi:hypothetical protein